MKYKYIAYTANREIVKGSMSAATVTFAEQELRNQGFEPLNLAAGFELPTLDRLFPSLFTIKTKDVIDFSRQLALLLECGVAISAALQLLQVNVANRALRKTLAAVDNELRTGGSFSQALRNHPKVFDDLYCRIVAMGEKTGNLELALRDIVAHLEKQQISIKKIKKALMYPVIVLVLAFGVVILMTTFVLPQMMTLFNSLRVEMPLPTRILLSASSFITANLPQLLLGAVVITFATVGILLRPSGKRKMCQILLTAPVIGKVALIAELARFSRTLSMLLKAGLNMTDVIEQASRGTRNLIIQDALRQVKQDLLHGRPLAAAMSRNSIFLPALVQMVAVGEETGRVEMTMSTIAQAYETEADERTAALIAIIEPAMTLVIAMIVGFIALAVIMPMYTLIGSLS